jgi:hypothetical protein
MLGIGAMLHHLGGGSEHNPSEYYGRLIVAADIDDNRLRLTFDDGKRVSLWDNGQSCCESRYMTTDDDVQSLVGQRLRIIEAKDAANVVNGHYEDHEQVFVEVAGDKSTITVVNHNEHNGYYGGFGLTLTEDEV